MTGGIVANITEFSPHTKYGRSKSLRLVILSVAPELNYFTILLTSQIDWLSSEAWLQGYQQGGSKQKGWALSIFVEQHPAADLTGRKLHEPTVCQSLELQIIASSQGTKEARMPNLEITAECIIQGSLRSVTPYSISSLVLLWFSEWLPFQVSWALLKLLML